MVDHLDDGLSVLQRSGDRAPGAVVVDDLGAGSSGVGFVLSALGAGYLAGATICSRVARGRRGPDVIVVALAMIGSGFLALFHAPTLPTSLPGAFVTGVGGSIALVTAATTLQRATPDELRGRVVAASAAAQQAAQVVGTVIGALLLRSLTGWSLAVLLLAVAARRDARRRLLTGSAQ